MNFSDLESLGDWAQDEGWLDDTLLLGVDRAACKLDFGFRVPEAAPPAHPRERFLASHERLLAFSLIGAGGSVRVDGKLELPENMTLNPDEGAGVAFVIQAGDARVHAAAPAWQLATGGEIDHPIKRWIDPTSITFFAKRALTAADLDLGPTPLHSNWSGSRQRYGSALVRNVAKPVPVKPDERLGGGWCVGDPNGARVWLLGNSSATSTSATIERTASSPPELVKKLALKLASLLEWSTSGNTLVTDVNAWLALPLT